jgi:hypothetical protein
MKKHLFILLVAICSSINIAKANTKPDTNNPSSDIAAGSTIKANRVHINIDGETPDSAKLDFSYEPHSFIIDGAPWVNLTTYKDQIVITAGRHGSVIPVYWLQQRGYDISYDNYTFKKINFAVDGQLSFTQRGMRYVCPLAIAQYPSKFLGVVVGNHWAIFSPAGNFVSVDTPHANITIGCQPSKTFYVYFDDDSGVNHFIIR